jgi:hypothetical protein
MPAWLIVVLLIAYLAAPFVEVRLWRAGRLSDRAVTVLMLARFPVFLGFLTFFFGRFPDPIVIGVVAVILAFGYRWLIADVRERGEQLRSGRT